MFMLSEYINMNCVNHLVVIKLFEDQCHFYSNVVAISELCIICDYFFIFNTFCGLLLIPYVGLSLHSNIVSL